MSLLLLSLETIESDDCAIAGLNRRCPGIGCVWQSNRGVPEPAKGLRDPAFTGQSGYSQSASLLAHNRIAASQLIRSGLYHS